MVVGDLIAAVAAAVPGADPKPCEIAGIGPASPGAGIVVSADKLLETLRFLRDDPACAHDMLTDITAIDREPVTGKIEVLYLLRSLASGSRVLVKVEVDPADPRLPTATGLWKGADWTEREIFDMFGVHFEGHPDLRRILLYEEFEGHPLRKSYPFDRRQPRVVERDPVADPWPERR